MYKITLPIYYTKKYKTKKDRTFLVGLNWYRNANYHELNEVKLHYHKLVKELLQDVAEETLESYRVNYQLFYKNKRCDLMNVVSVVDKFLNDALVEIGLITDDNVSIYRRSAAEVGGQDKENPRIEIIIEKKEI